VQELLEKKSLEPDIVKNIFNWCCRKSTCSTSTPSTASATLGQSTCFAAATPLPISKIVWGMDGKKKRYRLAQIIMSPLFLQICKLFANVLTIFDDGKLDN
jgi:hypothetical protein